MQDINLTEWDIDLRNLSNCNNHIVDAWFYSRKADYFRKENDKEKVIESLLSCVHLDPSSLFQEDLIKCYLEYKKPEQAIRAAQKYAEDLKKGCEQCGLAFSDRLHKLGEIMFEAEQYDEAVYYFVKSINVGKWEKTEWSLNTLIQYLFDVAKTYSAIGDNEKRREYYAKCSDTMFPNEVMCSFNKTEHLQIVESLICCDRPDPILVIRNYMDKNPKYAAKLILNYAEYQMTICEKNGWRITNLLHSLGELSMDAGRYDDAIDLFRKSIEGYSWEQDEDDVERLADYLFDIARAYGKKDESEMAIEYYQKSIDTESQLGRSTNNIAYCYRNMGNLYRSKKQHSQALECMLKAFDIWKNDSDYTEEAMNACEKIGHIYYANLFDYDKAVSYYTETIKYAEILCQVDSSLLLYVAYRNLANAYFYGAKDQSWYEKARSNYLKCMELWNAKDKSDDPDKVYVYANIGHCCAYDKNTKMGIETYYKALGMHRRLNLKEDANLARYYDDLGVYYYWDKQFDKAIENYRKAFNIGKRTVGEHGRESGSAALHIARALSEIPEKKEEALIYARKAKESYLVQNRSDSDIRVVESLIKELEM